MGHFFRSATTTPKPASRFWRIVESLQRLKHSRSSRTRARAKHGLHLTSLTAPMASTTRLTPEEWKIPPTHPGEATAAADDEGGVRSLHRPPPIILSRLPHTSRRGDWHVHLHDTDVLMGRAV